MMTHSRRIILVVTATFVVVARSASAQPAPAPRQPPTQKQLEQARTHFEAAEAAKSRREYQSAALEYLAAYELFQEPEFFYNVAEVYRLAGDEPNGLSYYEKYLELDPNGRGAVAARSYATQLRRSIAAQQDALARAAIEDEKRKEERERKADPPAQPEPAASPEHPGRGLRIAGIAAGGAGVVSLGAGVLFGFRMRSIEDEISTDSVYRPSRYADGEAAERNMYLFTGVGVAAVVTGGVLYYLGHRAAQSEERNTHADVTFTPVIRPSQIALSMAGHF